MSDTPVPSAPTVQDYDNAYRQWRHIARKMVNPDHHTAVAALQSVDDLVDAVRNGLPKDRPAPKSGQTNPSTARLANWVQGYCDALAGRIVASANIAYQAGYGAGLADRGTP